MPESFSPSDILEIPLLSNLQDKNIGERSKKELPDILSNKREFRKMWYTFFCHLRQTGVGY